MPETAVTSWAHSFEPFGWFHLICTGLCAVVMLVLCLLGRRWRKKHSLQGCATREHTLRRVWVWSIVVWQAGAVVWWLLPGNFDIQDSLPLHVCDLAAWLAPLALLSKSRFVRTMLYFWAIGLSTQAFVTPILTQGYTDPRFWLFWVGHTQIVGSSCYCCAVLGYRPGWRDLRTAAAAGLGYALFVFGLNIALHTNYGYVGNSAPEQPTLIDRLGPWPVRAVWVVALAMLAQALAWVPWVVVRQNGNRHP